MTNPDVLLAALRPFAEAAATLDDGTAPELRCEDTYCVGDAMWDAEQPTVGDLRRARSAIAAFEAEQKEGLDYVVENPQIVLDALSAAFEAEQNEATGDCPCIGHPLNCYNHPCDCGCTKAAAQVPSSDPDDFASAERIANAVLETQYRDPALSILAREYLRLAQAKVASTDNDEMKILQERLIDAHFALLDARHDLASLRAAQTSPVPSAETGWRDLTADEAVADALAHSAQADGGIDRALAADAARRLRALAAPTPPVLSAEDDDFVRRLRLCATDYDNKPMPDEAEPLNIRCGDLRHAADRIEALSRQPDRDAALEATPIEQRLQKLAAAIHSDNGIWQHGEALFQAADHIGAASRIIKELLQFVPYEKPEQPNFPTWIVEIRKRAKDFLRFNPITPEPDRDAVIEILAQAIDKIDEIPIYIDGTFIPFERRSGHREALKLAAATVRALATQPQESKG